MFWYERIEEGVQGNHEKKSKEIIDSLELRINASNLSWNYGTPKKLLRITNASWIEHKEGREKIVKKTKQFSFESIYSKMKIWIKRWPECTYVYDLSNKGGYTFREQ